jgi:DNA helicase-2/ATP-dependent DNA helicase PcrA
MAETLTAAQREAIEHGEGPLLILAGPGSGKTRVITHRIARLLQCGAGQDQILALTFTNKAAEEMRQRVDRMVPGQRVWISTFHRFCSRLLRRYSSGVGLRDGFTIYDAADSLRALRDVVDALRLELVHSSPERVAHEISWAKNNLVGVDEYLPRPGHALGGLTAQIYPAYQQRLLASNAVDFDDLLLHVVQLLRESPALRSDLDRQFRYILVDEYQDTNLAQYVIVRALSNDFPNLCVTGDPDQSIYGWRGANLSNILEFEKDFPQVKVVRLQQNHRSLGNILRVADELISHNLRRKQKSLFTDKGDGRPVRLVGHANSQDEARDIAERIAGSIRAGQRRPGDFAIFYRVNALSRVYEMALAEQGVPYQIVSGTEFYQRKEVKDVLAYLQLINNPRDDVALARIINVPPRGIGKKTIQCLTDHARKYGLTWLEAVRRYRQIDQLSKRGATQIGRFVDMLDRLTAAIPLHVEEITRRVLLESGYHESLCQSDAPSDQDRRENIEELLTAAWQYDQQHPEDGSLEDYLEQAALVSETDSWNSASERVTLMTLHAAKGLEFPVVHIVGLEHGLLPHQRSHDDPMQMEEERRLLFVGITRAREELQLSFAKRRAFRGVEKRTIPSQFLMELPRTEMDVINVDRVYQPACLSEQLDYEPDWEHASVAYDEPTACPAPDGGNESPASVMVHLTTAADLVGAAASRDPGQEPGAASDQFRPGMLVKHPEYGLGKVISLSGGVSSRRATVQFFTPNRQGTFYLRYCQLIAIQPMD